MDYHKPSDEYSPNWDLSGAVEDLRLFFMVGYVLAVRGHLSELERGNGVQGNTR